MEEPNDMEEPAVVAVLTPVDKGPGVTELERHLRLKCTHKVGRAVQGRTQAASNNAVFDSKVLSRSHAEIWSDQERVYIRDTKSSNGTYVNDERLSPSGVESDPPRELKTGDILKLGVDVIENASAAHKCVVLRVSIILPGSTEPICPGSSVSSAEILAETARPPVAVLRKLGEQALVDELDWMCALDKTQRETIFSLKASLSDVSYNRDGSQSRV